MTSETVGDVGIVHNQFDPTVFADGLEEYRRNSQQCLDMVNRGRLRYETEFSSHAIQRKLVALVREVETSRNG